MREAPPCRWRCSPFLQAWALGVVAVAGHVGHVPITSLRPRGGVGGGLVDHDGLRGVGAEWGQHYGTRPAWAPGPRHP